MAKNTIRFLAGILVAGTASLPAVAQTINYGELESLFNQPVTTSATGKPERQTDVPVTMDIISADDIRRSGATDIPEILRQVSGLDVWRWNPAYADVGVRGYNQPLSPRLLVLVNGRQVYTDFYGMTVWSAIPVELAEIRQIEVVKGPNTALFGFNAVGGVVNIVTFSPLYDDKNAAEARVGTQNWRQGSVVKTVKLGDVGGIRVSAGLVNAEDFDTEVPTNDIYGRMDPRRRSLSADSLFQVTDASQLGVEVTYSDVAHGIVLPDYAAYNLSMESYSAKTSYTADTQYGLLSAILYKNWASADFARGDSTFDHAVTVAQLQDLFKIGNDHSFRAALEYRHNLTSTTPRNAGNVTHDILSPSLMWNWAIAPSVSLTNAARLDHVKLDRTGPMADPEVPGATSILPFTNDDYDRRHNEFSFNSGVVYRPTRLDTFRVMASRGIQMPQMAWLGILEATDFGGGTYAAVTGNPNINPAVVMNYEAGYDRRVPQWDSLARFSLYHQDTKDIIASTWQFASFPPFVGTFNNAGSSRANGFEVGLESSGKKKWRWGVSYAYEMVEDEFTFQPITADRNFINFENTTPRHRVNGRVGYSTGPWELDLFANYISGTEQPYYDLGATDPLGLGLGAHVLRDVPDRVIVNARVGYQIVDNVSVALSGLSINQGQYRETTMPEVERRVYLTLRTDF